MGKRRKLRVAAVAAAMALTGCAMAAPHRPPRPHRVAAVVVRPTVITHVCNSIGPKERLAMAVAYIKSHGHITAKQYARLTKLPKATAEAELEAFARGRHNPITGVTKGKKKVYVMNKK